MALTAGKLAQGFGTVRKICRAARARLLPLNGGSW